MSDSLHQVVLCDMCVGEDKKPAQKTCMKCEISMCVHHLQGHLTTPVLLQTHPLTQPTVLGSTVKCPQHGKLLEYYCLDCMTCVCVSCAIEDQHRLHNMMTFSKAHRELTEKLSVGQKTLLEKTKCGRPSLENWNKSEREKLSRSGARLTEAVANLRDMALTRIQTSVSARMVAIKTSKSSIQAAQNEKDTFRFLQMFSQVHQDMEKAKAVDLMKGLEPGKERDKLVEKIRQSGEKMVEEAIQFWGSLLTFVDPENQEFASTSSDLMFDPITLGDYLSLSEDKTKVFYNSWMGTFSAQTLCIKSVKTVPDIQRWVVNLSKDYDWTIGLCSQMSINHFNNGDVYGLYCQGHQLSSVMPKYDETNTWECSGTEPPQKKCQLDRQVIAADGASVTEAMPRPKTVEVVWSAPSSLSFFNKIDQHRRLKIVTINVNCSGLTPFVRLEQPQQNVRGNQQHQSTRTCSYGRVHTQDITKNDSKRSTMSQQAKCPCGQVCQALLLSLSAVSLSLVCEEDGTEVESEDFLMMLPDNTILMALEPGQTWRPQRDAVVPKSQKDNRPRTGRDIARVTFDLYRLNPMDVFGSLSVKATFQGLYSVSADFQCLGPKKILREALRVASTLLQTAGHLLIASAGMIRRIIEGAEFWQPQRAEYTATWK